MLLAQPGADPSGFTAWQAVLLFAGVPLALVVAISAVVVAIERRPGRRIPARGPTAPERDPTTAGGVIARSQACLVGVERGREIHHDPIDASADPAGATRQRDLRRLDAACWTVTCTGCGRPYLEDGNSVHFATAAQAVETVQAYGWTSGTADTRCPTCQR